MIKVSHNIPNDELAKKYLKKGMQVEYIIALGRSKNRERIEQKIGRILEVCNHGYICGMALAGPELPDTVKPYEDLFRQCRNSGMGIEIHAGEWQGPELIRESLEYGYPHRIGHALSLFQDPDLVAYVKENNIHIEYCPTGNFLITEMARIEDHPITSAKEHGLNFSINTDDPGPYCTDMNKEFQLVHEKFGFDFEDFRKITQNSLKAGFGSKRKF